MRTLPGTERAGAARTAHTPRMLTGSSMGGDGDTFRAGKEALSVGCTAGTYPCLHPHNGFNVPLHPTAPRAANSLLRAQTASDTFTSTELKMVAMAYDTRSGAQAFPDRGAGDPESASQYVQLNVGGVVRDMGGVRSA